jgi:carbonic anhydrase/acetyltransferase-like protein (isoleucine patch superfamily)
MIIALNGKRPQIGRGVFIAPTAVLIGDVLIGDGASIWYGTVLRGDMERISVGEGTNIQDNCTVHTDFGHPALIGARVSVGHNAVVHGCTVEEECLIAIGAVVLNGALLRRGSVVAAGSVVREGQEVAAGHLVAGVPAVFKAELTAQAAARFRLPVENYRRLAQLHLEAGGGR